MEEKPTSVQKEYNNLFATPIDSMFAVMPFVF
jgi:hypothetical protein